MPVRDYTPIIYEPIQHPLTQEANSHGYTVEEYLKLLEAQNNQKSVIYTAGEDPTKYRQGADKLSVDTAREIKAEGELKLKQEAAKAAEAIMGMGLPSTYVNTGLEWSGRLPLSLEASMVLDLTLPLAATKLGSELRYVPKLAFKPKYNKYSYIRQIGSDALPDIRRGYFRSTASTKSNNSLLSKSFEDQMFNTGRPFYSDWKGSYIVTEPRQLTPISELKKEGLEWIESGHKGHSRRARQRAIESGINPDTSVGRIVIPLYNGDKNVIPVNQFGKFTLYEPVSIFGRNLPLYKVLNFNKTGGKMNYLNYIGTTHKIDVSTKSIRKWAGGAVATRLSPFKQYPSNVTAELYLFFDPTENDLELYAPNPQEHSEVELKKVEVPEKTTATKPGSWKEFRDTLIAALLKKGFTGEAAQTLVAQMGLETGHGKHMSGDYNYGNITAGKNWSGKTVLKVDNHNGKTYSFRSYDDLDLAMNDYVNLLTRSYGVTPLDTKDQIYAKLTGGNLRGRKWAEAQNYTQNIDSVYNMYWK